MEAHTHLYIFTYVYMYVCHYWRTLTATLCTVWKVSLANFYKSYKMHTHTNPHTKSMWANLQSRRKTIKIHKSKYTTQRQCCQFAENERIFVCRAQTHTHAFIYTVRWICCKRMLQQLLFTLFNCQSQHRKALQLLLAARRWLLTASYTDNKQQQQQRG